MKKLTVFAALAVMMLGFAGTAQAQHHGHGGYHGGNYGHDYRGGYNGGNYGHDYRGGYGGWNRGSGIVIGGGGIDIIIGGGHRGYPYPYPDGGWRNYPPIPPTRIVYERVYDPYRGSYTVSHIARWDNYYRGYVWYDINGNLRVN